MLESYWKIAIRVLAKSKTYASIILLGLSVSITACILVIDYARFELSYDTFFANSKTIYRLEHNRFVDNQLLYKKAMNFPEVGAALQDYFSEVKLVTRLFPVSTNIEPVFTATTREGDRTSFSEPNAYLTDSAFCKIFDLRFIYGDKITALAGKGNVILSKTTALRYFKRLDVVGEVITSSNGMNAATVTGVFEDLPSNSHLKFDMLQSWFDVYGERSRFTWDGFYTYVLFNTTEDAQRVAERLPEFASSYTGEYYKSRPGASSQFELQPLQGIHLDSHLDGEMKPNGNRTIVYTLLIIAVLIITIAIINHVNLNTSRSLQRIKEVGIRKTIGSTQGQLSVQFLIESMILNFISIVISLLSAWLLLPWFNQLFNSDISLQLYRDSIFWLAIAGFAMFVSVLSGFYPAFILTRFHPYEALKGSSVKQQRSYLQPGLVTIQFSISLLLIIGTFVLFRQIQFMQTKDLGFGIERKLVVKILPGVGEEGDSIFNYKMNAIKTELSSTSISESATISSSIPGRKNEWRGSTRVVGSVSDRVVRCNLTRVDEDFLNAFDLKLVAGRNFSSSAAAESQVMVNAETVKQLDLGAPEEAIGAKVEMFGNREIIGVVESFHEADLHESLSPSAFITGAGYMKFLTLSMNDGNLEEKIHQVEGIWKVQFPNKPFQYFFLDDFFNRQYQSDILMVRSVSVLSGIAIVIACLGLFSLSLHTIHRKTKEIGIKKILGASIAEITKELCRNFLTPIGISMLISIPLSYYLINWWLTQYAYRMDFTPMLFIVPLLVLVGISLATIIFQSLRAAGKNPVESLKHE
ncbi:MAG: ABC transporter permease [Cyclobacteriaceae bacterium]|nr:ABC transporter permease [Cyclobacteriaceae bacterium]